MNHHDPAGKEREDQVTVFGDLDLQVSWSEFEKTLIDFLRKLSGSGTPLLFVPHKGVKKSGRVNPENIDRASPTGIELPGGLVLRVNSLDRNESNFKLPEGADFSIEAGGVVVRFKQDSSNTALWNEISINDQEIVRDERTLADLQNVILTAQDKLAELAQKRATEKKSSEADKQKEQEDRINQERASLQKLLSSVPKW